MIETVSTSTNNFPIILPECRGCIGILESAELEDGAAIAQIDGNRYEASAEMYDELRGLIGQRTIIACITGRVRVGRCTA